MQGGAVTASLHGGFDGELHDLVAPPLAAHSGRAIRITAVDCDYESTSAASGCASTTSFNGVFHEVRPSELIVQTFSFEGYRDSVALERLMIEDIGNGRTRLTATSLVDSFEGRDAFLASGMETGVREGYERLDELLAR